MVASEDGKVLHARQMTLNYHILIVVVLAILEGLHIHLSDVVQHAPSQPASAGDFLVETRHCLGPQ